MTIKQIIVGIALSSTIVGIMAHRVQKYRDLHKAPQAKSRVVMAKAATTNGKVFKPNTTQKVTVVKRKAQSAPALSTRKIY